MGYIKGFVHGAVVGAVAGLCVAPQEGRRTRQQLTELRTGAQRTAKQAQQVAQNAAPFVASAASTVKEQVDRVVRRGDNGVQVEGHATIRADRN